MTARTLNLIAQRHESRVLSAFLASRDGAAQRAGVDMPQAGWGENSTRSLTVNELAAMIGQGSNTAAGVRVNDEVAMRVSTVYASVGLVAGAIASLPFNVHRRKDRAETQHDYWWMLNEQPCDGFTAYTAWEYLFTARMLYGDGFARLIRPSPTSQRVIGWEPLHPMTVQPRKNPDDGSWFYRVQPNEGPAYALDDADMLHVPSLGYDPDTRLSPSPITYAAREAIATAIAAERYQGQFFNGGATFDYALKTSQTIRGETLETLRKSLQARSFNGGRGPLILTGGFEPAQLSVNSKDAEILATRLFTVEEICRIFGVPPHMVGHTEKNSSWGTGMEQQGTNFVRYTLMRHMTPVAQEFNRKLWPSRTDFYVKHDASAIARADLKTRFDAYRVALGRAGEQPWMTADEVRSIEHMPPNAKLNLNGPANAAEPTHQAPGE